MRFIPLLAIRSLSDFSTGYSVSLGGSPGSALFAAELASYSVTLGWLFV